MNSYSCPKKGIYIYIYSFAATKPGIDEARAGFLFFFLQLPPAPPCLLLPPHGGSPG